ncbi:MAG: hypothetical protein F6K00_19970 [Leptolyngbya sp. SIOISBB]|nr:hypothetical protein [Leptolyngbya sp. SIOISBB]
MSNDDMAPQLDCVESLLNSAGELLTQASRIAERNALDIEAITQETRRNAVDIRALTAASERHDRILDYLLRREAGELDSE